MWLQRFESLTKFFESINLQSIWRPSFYPKKICIDLKFSVIIIANGHLIVRIESSMKRFFKIVTDLVRCFVSCSATTVTMI